MVARSIKLKTPGRDDEFVERLHQMLAHVGVSDDGKTTIRAHGLTVNRAGYDAIASEVTPDGKLFGHPVFLVLPQKERGLVHWTAASLHNYLSRYRLRPA